MLGDRKTLKDLLTGDQLEAFTTTVKPVNVKVLHDALKEKLKEDPDYEVWVPLVYYRCKQYVKREGVAMIVDPPNVFISNKGDILSVACKKNPRAVVLNKIPIGGYYYTAITRGKKQINVMVHRALASTFIPVGELFKDYFPTELQVNHMNGDKLDLELTNLEWATPLANTRHAIDNGWWPHGKK